jgi:hypothetical protein
MDQLGLVVTDGSKYAGIEDQRSKRASGPQETCVGPRGVAWSTGPSEAAFFPLPICPFFFFSFIFSGLFYFIFFIFIYTNIIHRHRAPSHI